MSMNAKNLKLPHTQKQKRRCTTYLGMSQSGWSKFIRWTTFFLAFSFYFLTVLYTWRPELVSRLEPIGGSPAQALQLLAILSGIANPMLSAAIGQAIDVLRRMLMSRSNGQNFMDNLPLRQGIGVEGLWDILRIRHLPRFKPKAWAVFKIVSMLIVPILAILILTKVDTALTVYPTTTVAASRGYGIGEFNSSLAILLNPLTDLTFSTRFKDFLSDPDRSVETTSDSDRDNCINNVNSTCRTSYYVPGGVENFAPALLAGKKFTNSGSIQPVLALNQRGYVFEFEDDGSVVDYDPDLDCITSGFVIGAFRLCLKNGAANELLAYITTCPTEIATTASCLHNNSWHLLGGWSTTLSISVQYATIAFNGLNGTILSHVPTNDTLTPVPINARTLLSVYATLLGPVNTTTLYGASLKLLGLGTNTPVLPLTIWEYLQGFQTRAAFDTHSNRQAVVGLQSFLALALYHCQGKDFNELRRLLVGNGTSAGNSTAPSVGQEIIRLFPAVEPDTDVVPGVLRYNLTVDRSVLLAYIVLAGATLVLCAAALVAESCTRLGKEMREVSPFDPLDQICECEMRDCESGKRVEWREFERLRGKGAREQLSAVARMRVLLVGERSKGDLGEMGENGPLVVVKDEEENREEEEEDFSLRSASVSVAPSMLKSHFY